MRKSLGQRTVFSGEGLRISFSLPEGAMNARLDLRSEENTEPVETGTSRDGGWDLSLQNEDGQPLAPGYYVWVLLADIDSIRTSIAYGRVRIVSYDPDDRISHLVAMIEMIDQRIQTGDHVISRSVLSGGVGEIYRVPIGDLYSVRNRMLNDLSTLRAAATGNSNISFITFRSQ